ncbi:hypothetical protein HOG21_03760 [bacterium]|nr:hypothetical protein [bacterium]
MNTKIWTGDFDNILLGNNSDYIDTYYSSIGLTNVASVRCVKNPSN